MLTDIICAKCNGNGYITNFTANSTWTKTCRSCNGTGKLGEIDIDMVAIPRQEYEELLEYKRMYERLCY